MRRILSGVICVLVVLAGASVSQGAKNIYWELSGSQQGDIEGEVSEPDFEGQIEVLDFHHLLHRDFSQLPSTKHHEEIIVTIRLSKSAVSLMRALDTQELMNTCWFRFRRDDGMGGDETFYEIWLEGGRISAIEPIAPDNQSAQESVDLARVRLAYSMMNVLDVSSGKDAILIQGK